MTRKNDPWKALSDETRREMMDMLLEQGELSAGAFVEAFEMTQPAVSLHLRVLREAGMVSARRDGRRQLYRLEPDALRVFKDWITRYDRFWDERLDALGALLDEEG